MLRFGFGLRSPLLYSHVKVIFLADPVHRGCQLVFFSERHLSQTCWCVLIAHACTDAKSRVPEDKDARDALLKSYKHTVKEENPLYSTTNNDIGIKRPTGATFTFERRARQQGFRYCTPKTDAAFATATTVPTCCCSRHVVLSACPIPAVNSRAISASKAHVVKHGRLVNLEQSCVLQLNYTRIRLMSEASLL